MESVQNKIVKAALLGAGTVGSGVYELVKERQEDFPHICGTQIEIAKILVRDASKERAGIPSDLLTDSWEEIIADDSISIIIEVMGGIEPAKSYLLEAMKAGKQVVTANKDLIAEHGHELLDTAEKYGCDFKFEAAVAGCVPIIQVLKQSMSSENITEIMGIVNGTTNYILTRMTQSGMMVLMPDVRLLLWLRLPSIHVLHFLMSTSKELETLLQRIFFMQKNLIQ